jgi:hypothetical protein
VVLQLYSNDINSDESYRDQAILGADGQPVAIPGSARGWLSKQLRKSYLVRFLRKVQLTIAWTVSHWGEQWDVVGIFVEENPEISETSSELLLALKEKVTDAGAEFVFFVVPSKFRLENLDNTHDGLEFADKWKDWAAERDVSYIDMVVPFTAATLSGSKLFLDKDVHFNEDGHTITADAIERRHPSVFARDSAADASGN